MISRLAGTLLESDLTNVLVDVNGVGYAVTVPVSTVERLPAIGEAVVLLTHLAVREDAFTLYGFATQEERALFRLLMGVSGIGPRIALNVLSCMRVSTFCRTVADGDLKALSRINGIGKRSAERLVVELRDKVSDISPEGEFAGQDKESEEWSNAAADAVAALETLGYKREAARKAVRTIIKQEPDAKSSVQDLIRKTLALLNS